MWCVINKKLFNNNATLDGVPEPAAGLSGSDSFYDDQDFYNKYDVPNNNNNQWTSMLNARTCEIFDCNVGNRIGQLHKDTSPKVKDSDKHFTVLFVSNLEWYPDWGGELVFYDDEDTGHKHWRRDYNLGWPKDIVGNKPSRVICYRHDETHNTYPTKTNAIEMTQKIAFRVRVK